MKSKFAQKFNNDPIASYYDDDVKNEENPIRKGYGYLMKWIQEKTKESSVLIDLGCGTGNTSSQIDSNKKIYCADIFQNMLDLAKKS